MRGLGKLTSVFMALGMVSCSKVEVSTPVQEQRISYEITERKAAVAFPKDYTFKSTAYFLGDDTHAWDSHKAYASIFYKNSGTRRVELNDVEVKYNGDFWSTEEEFYWPSYGSLTFFSYRQPLVKPVISTEGVAFSSWNVSDHRDKALSDQTILVADIAKDKRRNENYASLSGVPTHFKHKLSKFTVKAAVSPLAEGDPVIKITSLTLKNIYLCGDYSRGGYSDDGWSGYKDLSAGYEVVSTPVTLTDDLQVMGAEMVMIPQMLSDEAAVHLEYTMTVNGLSEDKSVDLLFVNLFRTGEWDMGKSYIYTIYVGVGQYPIDFDGEVGNWDVADGSDVIVGGQIS